MLQIRSVPMGDLPADALLAERDGMAVLLVRDTLVTEKGAELISALLHEWTGAQVGAA